MNSLADHLASTRPHAAFKFHPACPLCRAERLSGCPPASAVPKRASVVLAAAVLAITPAVSAAPAFAADEGDSTTEGQAEPGTGPTGSDEASDPLLEVGGDNDGGQERDAGRTPSDSEPEGTGEAVPEPLESGDEEPPPAAPPALRAPLPPAAEPIAPPPVAPAPPPVSDLVPQGPVPAAGSPPTLYAHPTPTLGAPVDQTPAKARPNPSDPPITPPSSRPVAAPTTSGTDPAAPPSQEPPPGADDEGIHTVDRGESLWSIARDLAGGKASNAEVAGLVQRLWSLNAARMNTGSPDLLLVGTVLRLP